MDIYNAIKLNNHKKIKFLLNSDIDHKNYYDLTPIHYAILVYPDIISILAKKYEVQDVDLIEDFKKRLK